MSSAHSSAGGHSPPKSAEDSGRYSVGAAAFQPPCLRASHLSAAGKPPLRLQLWSDCDAPRAITHFDPCDLFARFHIDDRDVVAPAIRGVELRAIGAQRGSPDAIPDRDHRRDGILRQIDYSYGI